MLKWYRARIDGACKEKSSDGYDLYDVTFIDIGFSDKMTVQRMRPLDASLTTVPAIAKECVLALLRVPALGAEYGDEAANALQDWVHGVKLRIKSHGKDMAGRLQVSLWEEDGSCINAIMIESGVARISSTMAHRVLKRGGDEKDVELLRLCEAARETAKKARARMYCYGDVGDSDDERR
ncbi:hypothetical protein EON67_11890 [archaeon]|nr:MAG: hypothetical protein EON67_11890 [archaeon]